MQPTSTTKHLLVYVDDDPDDLLLVREAFVPYRDSLEVCLFEQSTEAYGFLLQLEENSIKPCLIILDMNMPGLSGRELLPLLRTIPYFDEVPVILFTTSSSQHDYGFALRHNAGFITKPMTFDQMELAAEEFLSHCTEEIQNKLKRHG